MPFLGISGTRIEGSQAYESPVLSRLSVSPASAYSLRRLSASATRAIQVRRSSDNATQDIGFIGNDLDVAALLAFVGANNGFVTTWYDQVGSNNFTQATAGSQPRIVNAGSVQVDSTGKPQVFFNGSASSMAATYTVAYPFTQNFTANPAGTQNSYAMLICAIPITTEYRAFDVQNYFEQIAGGAPGTADFGNPLSTRRIATGYIANLSQNMFTNGVSVGTNTTPLAGNGVVNPSIGQRGTAGGFFYTGGISEFMFFGSTLLTADRQILERNQGAYYAISVA